MTTLLYDMLVIGAGPAGISMAVEARHAGVRPEKLLILEKAAEHSFSLRKYYPDSKLVTANYKGFEAACTGVMCIPDLSKHQTITYLDEAIRENLITVRYNETVHRIEKHPLEQRFTVSTDASSFDTRVIAISIGILGKPNKPEYRLPPGLKDRIFFDLTTREIGGSDVLVVGGGDTASEYCQYLVQGGNTVTLSYRKHEFSRMNPINRLSLLALADRGQAAIFYGSNITGVRDAGGKPEVHFAEAGFGPRCFDCVVYALGGTTPHNFLKLIGIEYHGDAPYLKEGYETNVAGMFLIGDLSAGAKGGSIIWAFNSASTAMKKICRQYLTEQP
jgi:thioredoxin reductase (NADPH)